MKEQDKRDKHHKSESNPEKSFDAGKKGGKASTETTGQASNVLKASKITGNVGASGENRSGGGKQNEGR
ncbi:hypothetical protein [Pontibacter ruber]|uniref:Uncharacterized protein n=1 Tax=Pontibacter ruber TaxID=1343895 RepID=A0ABW5CYX9_9BACT|nr:hypothetical protein [Pontibacter ruber]